MYITIECCTGRVLGLHLDCVSWVEPVLTDDRCRGRVWLHPGGGVLACPILDQVCLEVPCDRFAGRCRLAVIRSVCRPSSPLPWLPRFGYESLRYAAPVRCCGLCLCTSGRKGHVWPLALVRGGFLQGVMGVIAQAPLL